MSYTLEEFAADCRNALKNGEGSEAFEKVRKYVERALKDQAFIEEHVPEETTEPRRIIYEDPHLGFCICAHAYTDAKQGEPHDHGPTWAIYGQAAGETEMTDWEIIDPPNDSSPGKVKKVRSYRMMPGDAHVYAPGDIHAPYRDAPTRLIRIEGQNTDYVKRTPLVAI